MLKIFSPKKKTKTITKKHRSASTSDLNKVNNIEQLQKQFNTVNKNLKLNSFETFTQNEQKNIVVEPIIDENKITISSEDSNILSEKSKFPEMSEPQNESSINKVQTGMDRYGFVLTKSTAKRRASPTVKPHTKKANLQQDGSAIEIKNKFQALSEDENAETVVTKIEKPPPLYLREKCSNELVELLKSIVGTKFFVVPVKRFKIEETKIQLQNVEDYKAVQNKFDTMPNKKYYTFQLKSARGLMVIIKGIECNVPTEDIKADLESQGFQIKNIFNIFNKNKIPQPMFRVELEPTNTKLKQANEHPIYKVRAVLHRRVTVEEPLKIKSVVQCFKCQEYGHTRGYCKLPDVCVICGGLHNTKDCQLDKTDVETKKLRKCSNCELNHTANYRGCPVYNYHYQKLHPKQRIEQVTLKNLKNENKPGLSAGASEIKNQKFTSYANAAASGTIHENNDPTHSTDSFQKLSNMMLKFMESMEKNMSLMMNNMSMLMQVLLQNNQK